MEISQVAQFMVGDRCDLINPIVKAFFSNEDLVKGHETCFDVITILLDGSWFLFAAAIVHNFVTIIVHRYARDALQARKIHHELLNSQSNSFKSTCDPNKGNDDTVNIDICLQ